MGQDKSLTSSELKKLLELAVKTGHLFDEVMARLQQKEDKQKIH